MSGPPYPRPVPGSGAIGTFIIGISPIGTVANPFDYWTTVISQYANSPVLTAMIGAFNDAMDTTTNLDNFYDFIWNVNTASGYGLDVWGRIVGVTRVVQVPGTPVGNFGFQEANSWVGFGQGVFFSGGSVTTNFVLNDTDFRTLILAKAASNICDGSIPAINAILLGLFPGRGTVYVADGLNMTLTYTFTFALTPAELAIMAQTGVLPNPCGVAINIVHP